MAPSKLSSEFPLPLELLCEIIKHLPLTDLQTLSLVSRLTRSQAIRFIFGHLRCTELSKVRNIHQAREDVKEVIKSLKLELPCSFITIGGNEDSLVIFQFLETLPNLQVLNLVVQPAFLSQFISSIRRTDLLELVIAPANYAHEPVEGLPTAGLAGLEKLSIKWNACDEVDKPGSSLAHLYEFIRPSLTTLVELSIDNVPQKNSGDFDLQLLKPAGDTLRSFEYYAQNADESILETIPAFLPHLTKLSIKCNSFTDYSSVSILWKDAHIQALSKNKNLTELTLSSDFEVNAQDTLRIQDDYYAWVVRCYKRRLKATQDIASACPRLQRCSWIQSSLSFLRVLTHSFIVEERMTGGNVTRVVRGIKQHWMGRHHMSMTGGGIVKCKLEDLPGDIVGRNGVE